MEEPSTQSTTQSPYTKSVDEALKEMYSFWEDAYGKTETKSSILSRPEISSIEVCSSVVTKAEGTNAQEDLAYIVNFKDNSGYSVLNTTYNGSPVFAFTEAGSLDVAKLQDAVNHVVNKDVKGLESLFKNEDFVYDYLATCIVCSNSSKREITTRTDSTWTELLNIHPPFITTKWGQQYPFNQSMPLTGESISANPYRGRYPTGCGIIAAAQIFNHTGHPSFYTITGSNNTWSTYSSLCTYINRESYSPYTFDSQTIYGEKVRMAALASCLKDLADDFSVSYGYDLDEGYYTSTLINTVKTAFVSLDPVYYANASVKMANYYMSDLLTMVDNNKPVYFRGDKIIGDDEYSGHAWVVDGYLTRRFYYGNIWYLQEPCLHFNWGWRGLHDGYYSTDSFLSIDRVYYDGVIDLDEIDEDDPDDYKYNTSFIYY